MKIDELNNFQCLPWPGDQVREDTEKWKFNDSCQ